MPEQSNSVNGEAEAVQYAVEVAVESEDIPLKPGFQMIMEFETEKRKVPTLPLSAVVSENRATVGGHSTELSSEEEEHYVFVVKDGKAERRPVEVGIVLDYRIEIKDGLESDEHVVANPPEERNICGSAGQIIRLDNIVNSYTVGKEDVPVLKGVNVTCSKGEFVADHGAFWLR